MISVIGNPLWRRFLRVIGREDIIHDPKFKDDLARFENRHELRPIVSQWVGGRTVEEVVKLLQGARVPCGKVNNIAEMVADPQVEAREMLVDMKYPEVGQVPLSGVVVKLSHTPGKIERPAPKVGEHNTEIYHHLLGLGEEELSQLKAEGVI
jgi:crotonobetainyl-CoA:carnitine CoA-transferase CaiB-like acyl-CoA transferase